MTDPDLDEQVRRFEERTARPTRTKNETLDTAVKVVSESLARAQEHLSNGGFRMESQRVAAREGVEELEYLVADLKDLKEDDATDPG